MSIMVMYNACSKKTYFLSVMLHPTTSSRVILLSNNPIGFQRSSEMLKSSSCLIKSIIQMSLVGLQYSLDLFAESRKSFLPLTGETRALYALSSGAGPRLTLTSLIGQKESTRVLLFFYHWWSGETTVDTPRGLFRGTSPNNEHIAHLSSFVQISLEFPYGDHDGVSLLL